MAQKVCFHVVDGGKWPDRFGAVFWGWVFWLLSSQKDGKKSQFHSLNSR